MLLLSLTSLLDVLRNIKTMMVISNLMSQLARSRDFDTSCPIRINVAQPISKVLNDLLGQIFRLVGGDKVVDWHDTSLCGLLRYKEEVELGRAFFILNETRIKDSSRLRIFEGFLSVNEHPLVDSLVDDDKSNLWRVHCVVDLRDTLSYLAELLVLYDGSHSFTNTVTEYHNF